MTPASLILEWKRRLSRAPTSDFSYRCALSECIHDLEKAIRQQQ